ncbi:rifin [Plasmodium falciparum IGH-CR14]|uniref:Rifin n=1 Tax=Plasmodium falciparum IGH-CR14 TaxID=580059 RepID=A0A0L1IA01_PLAFA|nr:rifin [Plasmodium falciparum IGH-CR14]
MKPHTYTNRSLCECELYAPSNYDNDPEMKAVMQQFVDRTTQRFQEYDERLQEKRQVCKDKCDKEIEKIILKDKLDKELTEKFATLHTDIQSDAIPTCVCEKSLADKTEKFCLNCGKTMGGVAPGWGLVSGLWYAGWSHYVATTVAKASTDAGISTAIKLLKTNFSIERLTSSQWRTYVTVQNYANENMLEVLIRHLGSTLCGGSSNDIGGPFCLFTNNPTIFTNSIKGHIPTAVKKAVRDAATAEIAEAAKYTSTTSSLTTGITASIIAIVVIVLIMVIIYLILRYRRKKKMKKKLQYIKLLEE